MRRAQLGLILAALDELRAIYPDDVKAYCRAVLDIAEIAKVERGTRS